MQCFRAAPVLSASLPLSLKMTCWIKDATTRIPCHSNLRTHSFLFKMKPYNQDGFFSGSPDGAQLPQTPGAAEGAVLPGEGPLQARLQKLCPADEGLALLQGRQRQEPGLLHTRSQGQHVLRLPGQERMEGDRDPVPFQTGDAVLTSSRGSSWELCAMVAAKLGCSRSTCWRASSLGAKRLTAASVQAGDRSAATPREAWSSDTQPSAALQNTWRRRG